MKQQIERLITKYSDPQNIGARSCYPEFVADLEILADSIEQLPAPLFTRTVYSVGEPPTRPRWIIKVYGEVTE